MKIAMAVRHYYSNVDFVWVQLGWKRNGFEFAPGRLTVSAPFCDLEHEIGVLLAVLKPILLDTEIV
jgi:hypothetical protein